MDSSLRERFHRNTREEVSRTNSTTTTALQRKPVTNVGITLEQARLAPSVETLALAERLGVKL